MKMTIADVASIKWPEQMYNGNIEFSQDIDGPIYISKWSVPEVPRPTVEELQDMIPDMQDEWDNQVIDEERRAAYPSALELTITMWEKIITGDSTEFDKVEAKRQTVKNKYPKKDK